MTQCSKVVNPVCGNSLMRQGMPVGDNGYMAQRQVISCLSFLRLD